MRQMEVTRKVIGDNAFYIKPFPAFVAVNISGDLASVLSPLLGGIASLFGGNAAQGQTTDTGASNIMDMDVSEAVPVLASAFTSLSGDKFERLMKKLLVDYENVSVEGDATEGKTARLTYDLANEVFCGDVQDMYILCFEVIKLNYSGVFKRLGVQSGRLKGLAQKLTSNTAASEN